METLPLQVYSVASNIAVIQAPGRRFPGSVVQGDSLARLSEQATTIFEALRHGRPDAETRELARELADDLAARLLHYQEVLDAHGIDLPYQRRPERDLPSRSDEPVTAELRNWVFRSNLREYLVSLGWLVRYSFDEDDWTAVQLGVASADAEASRWFDYTLYAPEPDVGITLDLAPDVGTAAVQVRARFDPSLRLQIEQSTAIFQTLRTVPPEEAG